ncbi:MAG: hypothetical protein ACFFD7_07745 [Candidatus Thorarchaeota archaeon]
MSNEREKVEDFISLWRKKMIEDPKKPEFVKETLDQIKGLEEENEKLRNKIAENIDLISKTEEIIKNTVEENNRLKAEISKASSQKVNQVNDLQKENQDLTNRIKSLINTLTVKDNDISVKDNEIRLKDNELALRNNELVDLKLKLNEAQSAIQFMTDTAPEDNPEISSALIEDLKSELSNRKTQVVELEKNVEELNTRIAELNEKLIEKETTSHVDYVIPVETKKTEVLKPQPVQASTNTLEILCQDLQADLNKYKRIVDNLTKEKTELENTLKSEGIELNFGELNELKNENKALKMEVSQLQETLKEKAKTTTQTLSLVEAERLVEDLQKQVKIKDQTIAELKSSTQPQIITPQGPMTGLVEELQNNINKLKIALEEKNKIIESLKSS